MSAAIPGIRCRRSSGDNSLVTACYRAPSGLASALRPCSQGVALGCIIAAFQAGIRSGPFPLKISTLPRLAAAALAFGSTLQSPAAGLKCGLGPVTLANPTAQQSGPVPKGHLTIAQCFSVGNSATGRQVPKGRLNPGADPTLSAVPSGLGPHRRASPTLKRWAMVSCPSGTGGRRMRKRHWV